MASPAEPLDRDCTSGAIGPDITYALSAFPHLVKHRAEATIRMLLGKRLPEAERASRLTGDGFPFELAFCTADDRLRYTIEPESGDVDPARRLIIASQLIRGINGAPLPSDVLDDLRRMQSGGPLAYGTWIGCRVDRNREAYKMYIEVPPGGQIPPMCPEAPMLPDREVMARMVAYTPSTKVFESYVRVPSLEPRHVPAVLAAAEMELHSQSLLDVLENAYGYVLRGRLPGPSVGISYVVQPAHRRVTLHFYARALWGSDANIRRGFSRLAAACAWNDAAYRKVTAPIAARECWTTFHGLFGITLDGSQHMSLSIGVRPVSP